MSITSLAIHRRTLHDEVAERLKALILDGQVTVAARTIRDPSAHVNSGDTIIINLPEAEAAIPKGETIPLTIVYEDFAGRYEQTVRDILRHLQIAEAETARAAFLAAKARAVLLPQDMLDLFASDEETFMDRASMRVLVIEQGETPAGQLLGNSG